MKFVFFISVALVCSSCCTRAYNRPYILAESDLPEANVVSSK